MKKIKVSEATNPQLDWLVAKCLFVDEYDKNRIFLNDPGHPGSAVEVRIANQDTCLVSLSHAWHPTTNWSQMGPVIEREKINLEWWHMPKEWHAETNEALRYDDKGEFVDGSNFPQHGPTMLVAAARCYVTSKMGVEVEVPEELT